MARNSLVAAVTEGHGKFASRLRAAFLAAVFDEPQGVGHVHRITAHVAIGASDYSAATPDLRDAMMEQLLASRGASLRAGPFATNKVLWPLPDQLPLVSIIIPTRDRVDLLRTCITSLLEHTTYPEYEILVVDNGSAEAATLAYLDGLERDRIITVIRDPSPYNYSALNNLAVHLANGTFLALLNNDTEIVDGSWLEEMMRHAVRADVGAVGAKLLYPDGRIQHAGVVIGMGQAAGHAHRFQRNDEPGYFKQAHVTRRASAVTAACLVVAKDKFLAVGGLDETHFAVAYNDVDLCLKLEQRGWTNVYVPHAVLVHHESVSRGSDLAPAHSERYLRELAELQRRWNTKTYVDPMHHPALDPGFESYVLRFN
jgi:GT2 family glycosyltransferase